MLNEFKQYLLGIGKSENTALNYCDKVKLYFKWCLDSFGSEPQQLYRANVLDYISYMKTIKRYSPKSVNNHLSSLRSFNEFLIFSGRQTELAIVKNDFMKIQTQYANPCTVEQKDVEAFRQRLLEGGNKRDFAIVTLYTYTGIRRSECVNLRLDQINLIAKEIYVVGKGDKQRTVYAQAVIDYLQYELIDHPGAPEIPSGDSLPTPLNPKNWEKTEMIPLENTRREGPFSIQRYANQQWIDRVLYTAAPGARVSFDFEGRGLCLGFSFGLYSAVFQCRIDGGERFIKDQDRAEWVPPDSWFTNIVMADDLPYGKHTFELTVQFGNAPACMGTDFRLVYIGVLK